MNTMYFFHFACSILIFLAQDIKILLMGGLQQQNFLFWSVLICAILSQSDISSRRHGGIWTHTGMLAVTLDVVKVQGP